MLLTWQEGIACLRCKHIYALGDAALGDAFIGFSEPNPTVTERHVIGRSDLLGRR